MNRALVVIALLVVYAIRPVQAIVTSDQFGTHAVAPATPRFGVNLDGVVMVGAAPPSGDPLLWGTGCLITDRHVLTAAHLFDDDEDGQVDWELQLFPQNVLFDSAEGLIAVEHDVASIQWPDSWPSAQGHLAVLTLTEDAPAGVPRYPLYGGQDEVGRSFVLAGYGRPGHGATGQAAAEESPPVKRAGLNRFEAVRDDYPGVELLAYDFDSGLPENNSLALTGVESDLGFGIDEVFPTDGDSGGPSFLGGAVAGITSFVGSHPEADVTGETDSSWGEGGFNIRVSLFRDFIIAATGGEAMFVSEPSSLLLVLAFGVAAKAAHRGRQFI